MYEAPGLFPLHSFAWLTFSDRNAMNNMLFKLKRTLRACLMWMAQG